MVIAHVLTSLEIGGGERVTLELASAQAALGHRVLVISLAEGPDGPLAEALRERRIPVFRVPKRGPGVDATVIVRLVASFLRERVEVAHLHNRLPLIYGVPAARLTGAVAVHTRHGPRAAGARQEWLSRLAARGLHAYAAVSEDVRRRALESREIAPERLWVIDNGVDVDRFRPTDPAARTHARAALGIPDGAWVVGAVGRFAPEKDFPMLVRAVAPLLGEDLRLLLVGDGAEMGRVRAEVDAQGVGGLVSLPGARSDIPACLAAMDVFVLSSRMEGTPIAVLEAMAAGLPLIASAVGGLPALVTHGENGFLFPSGDEAALRARVGALRDDPPGAARVAEAGRRLVEVKHSREAMARQYLELYARRGVHP
jgi:glycosyltransferase involved in cell wall biosynthesis